MTDSDGEARDADILVPGERHAHAHRSPHPKRAPKQSAPQNPLTRLSTCSTSGGVAKQWPTSLRHSAKSAEARKSTTWFSTVSQRDEQAIAPPLLDRALELDADAALGAPEERHRLGDARLELGLEARLHVDLRDLEDHELRAPWIARHTSSGVAGMSMCRTP